LRNTYNCKNKDIESCTIARRYNNISKEVLKNIC
jgi:hypothetical protein